MQSLLQETQFLMNKYHIKANKALGQNFLINEEIVEQIIESAEITQEDLVIEIGPGLGTLTKELLQKAGKVICIELDKKMIKILNERFFLYRNFEILNQDVLKEDLKELIKKEKQEGKIKFSVKGYGHGVGMSQTGADALAKQGKTAEDIIHHFYQDVEIKQINS